MELEKIAVRSGIVVPKHWDVLDSMSWRTIGVSPRQLGCRKNKCSIWDRCAKAPGRF
jgi:hypothetical protein